MRVFWKRGYEGASLPELTRAMGINRPSLYAAFGNKQALFRKAVERYVVLNGAPLREALAQPSVRAVVEHLLRSTASHAGSGSIRGCLLVQGALACGDSAESVRRELSARRADVEAALRERFERAVSERDLPRDANPAALAKFVATFQHGLAVQLASGATREDLLAAVEVALRAWPDKGR
jgi:AcrR family transcriptional regulator